MEETECCEGFILYFSQIIVVFIKSRSIRCVGRVQMHGSMKYSYYADCPDDGPCRLLRTVGNIFPVDTAYMPDDCNIQA
jgi:hypothetical protein